jgi:hypothetical protein
VSATLTDAGPVIDTQASAFAELSARVRQLFDADLVITQSSDLGKILTVFAEANVSNQQFLVQIVDTLDVNNATGVQLIALGAINGVSPLPATRSEILLQLGGTAGLDVGDKRVRYEPNGSVFRTPLGATLPPSGVLDVTAVGETTGPLLALESPATDWVIVDGTTGWESVRALSDVKPIGRTAESQEEFRARVIQAGEGNGAATEPAVKEGLLATNGVSSLRLLNNRKPIIDANGVAGFHVEAIVSGGTDEDIGETLLAVLGATTPTQGSESVTVIDPVDGASVVFRFSRLGFVRIIFRVSISEAGAELPRDADAVERVTNAVVAYVESLDDGIDVVPAVAAAQALASLTPGSATDSSAEAARFGDVPSPAILPIAPKERTIIFGSPQAATVVGTNFEPFDLTAGDNVDVAFDNGNVVSVVFNVADFPIISQATASQVAAVFQSAITTANEPGGASALDGKLVLQSDSTGSGSLVEILPSSAAAPLAALGLVVDTTIGTETDVEVVFA